MSGRELGTTLLSVNQGGIAALSDGSFWRIAPDHLKRIRAWRVGMLVEVAANDSNLVYSHSLTDPEGGISVNIIPSSSLR